MIARNKAKAGALVLALGGLTLLSAADGADKAVTQSARAAAEATKALAKHNADAAIAAAEQAVTGAPRVAAYRLLLGQSYLQAGRFASAGQAFGDALALAPDDGRAALNLALTQVAGGDWQAARRTLAAHADTIPTADRGLALALAGDTPGAVALLTQVARSPEASAKVRQNLALAYALAGQWQLARAVAAADMSPADVDARLAQWAQFAQPRGAADQVASLIGVQPVVDRGQPVALALVAPVPTPPLALAAVTPPPAPAPVAAPVAALPTNVVVSASVPAMAVVTPAAIVQPVTAAMIHRDAGAFKMALPARRAVVAPTPRAAIVAQKAWAHGDWFVQLGAFRDMGIAKHAWSDAHRRFAGFGGHTPSGVQFRTASATLFRLSVGGFTRANAVETCRAWRAKGGVCFVRGNAGDQVASWAKPAATQVAMR